jgi:hypothetical protein
MLASMGCGVYPTRIISQPRASHVLKIDPTFQADRIFSNTKVIKGFFFAIKVLSKFDFSKKVCYADQTMEKLNSSAIKIGGSMCFALSSFFSFTTGLSARSVIFDDYSGTSVDCLGTPMDTQLTTKKDIVFQESTDFLRRENLLYRIGNDRNSCERRKLTDFVNKIKGVRKVCGGLTVLTNSISTEGLGYYIEPVREDIVEKKLSDAAKLLNISCSLFPGLELKGVNISNRIYFKDLSNALKDQDGNSMDAGGLFSPQTKTIELSIQDSDMFRIYLHELMHYIDDKYNVSDWKTVKQILGENIFEMWRMAGYLDNNNTVPGKKLSPGLLNMLERSGLRDYSLYMQNNTGVGDMNKVIEELSVLESVEEIFRGSDYWIKKNKLQIDLKVLENNLVVPTEVVSTAIESLLTLDDNEFNRPEVQSMLHRFFDVVYSKSKLKIFSPQLRREWVRLVRMTYGSSKNSDYSTANSLIKMFYRKHGLMMFKKN